HAMSVVALSPVAPEPLSPMATSVTPVTPTVDHGRDLDLESQKPPPLHTGADWKVVLHLPEIETWLRATGDRVTQLTHSAGQDADNRHVDVHLVQLKDICEDISDHVEQIHALLETEFSLKLLSYSVNIIVDIRTVQLLWHQLRVSVLVLKERLLQGLQDPNGNYTRQTDILQAFSQDQHQTRLDALTEVDDCGQLTIRCSQDYFSLDCGITAFELSDYSPGDEPEARDAESDEQDAAWESAESEGPRRSNHGLRNSLPELTAPADVTNHNRPPPPSSPTVQCGTPGHSEGAKRPLQGVSRSIEASPTQPSLPKRAALYSDGGASGEEDSRGGLGKAGPLPALQFQAELSRSTPSLMDPPDRSKFWLELDSVYPENVSQSYESLQVGPLFFYLRDVKDLYIYIKNLCVFLTVCSLLQQEAQPSPGPSPDRQHWYGSEEFLALPAQLRKTEMLAMKLESLAQSIPRDALQDVDDWDLTEMFLPSDLVSSSRPSVPQLPPYRRNPVGRFSPASSSDIAPSVGESIESGPLSELQSEEDEGRGSASRDRQQAAPLVDGRGGASLVVQQLLEDIQSRDKDPDVWGKIECFVQQLDGFISWLQEALDSTENWTQPRQELDSLGAYLDTHLSFKMNVDAHTSLKENVMEEGGALLAVITAHQSGLKEILHMVSGQWDQLQRQIRRQHGWMLRALRCVQARLLYAGDQSCEFSEASPSRRQPIGRLREAQRAALEQMAVKLSSLRFPSSTSRWHCGQVVRSNSLQEFQAEYQELWDWLMDMDAMVVDSHQLMMSEEQRHHLFKVRALVTMESRKTGLLGRAEVLKRSGVELPDNFHRNNLSANANSLLVGGRGVAVENPRSALSPLTNSLLEQLEARIKELKAWLRDTELLIFNSCLRQDKDASEQLRSFKSLCAEVRARRRGISSVLKLCQKLLQQSQHREALQLLSINLERRWEAIVMQALQWQNRLKRELGEQQVRAA
uniref:A kinase (PRKA) anchor protein 6 n=1 Tax=Scophthalmus maximus TaxID=52904 RepID=A0A8D3B9B2_SCOMX